MPRPMVDAGIQWQTCHSPPPTVWNISPGPSVECVFKRAQMEKQQFFRQRQENGRVMTSRGHCAGHTNTSHPVPGRKAEPHPALMNSPCRIPSWQEFTIVFSPEGWGRDGVGRRRKVVVKKTDLQKCSSRT